MNTGETIYALITTLDAENNPTSIRIKQFTVSKLHSTHVEVVDSQSLPWALQNGDYFDTYAAADKERLKRVRLAADKIRAAIGALQDRLSALINSADQSPR